MLQLVNISLPRAFPHDLPIIGQHRADNDCGGARSALRIEKYERNTA